MEWFRFYSEVVRDPKVQRLAPPMFKHWINVLCLASDNEPRGQVPPAEDVAFHLRLPLVRAIHMLEDLANYGLLDDDDGVLTAHGWNARQYKSDNVTERVRKHRRNVSVTPPDTEAEQRQNRTETEAEADAPRRDIFVLFDSFMGRPSVTEMMRDVLIEAEKIYDPSCISHCFEEAAKSSDGRRSWKYVASILERHAREGCFPQEREPVASGPAIKSYRYDD